MSIVDGTLASQNKTFFWEINVQNGSATIHANTSDSGQNVSRIHLEECNATWPIRAINFSAFDEGTSTRINPFFTAQTYNFWLGNGSTLRNNSFSNTTLFTEFPVCIDPPDRNFTLDAQVEYNDVQNSSTYNTRNYFFQEDIINNDTQRIPLFLLNVDDSTSFILKVQDINLIPIENALIFTQRLDLVTGNFTSPIMFTKITVTLTRIIPAISLNLNANALTSMMNKAKNTPYKPTVSEKVWMLNKMLSTKNITPSLLTKALAV